MKTFCDANTRELRALRIKNGYSPVEVAEAAGMKGAEKTLYQKYLGKETNRMGFTLDEVIGISRFYNLSMTDINLIFFDNRLPL